MSPDLASSQHPERRECQWGEEIRSGSSESFEALFRAYYVRLCRFAYRLTGSRTIAEEVVQDVFVRLWELRSQLPQVDSINAYLYRAVRNQVINHLKRSNLMQELESAEFEGSFTAHDGPEEELHRNEITAAVREAIELLPPRCRLIFVLHRFDGLRYREIAHTLDISIKTVEVQMGRALKTLRRLLVQHYPLLLASLSFNGLFS
jgi:RNA polymerase sigma-70 factor (ECF subfamily)